MRVFWLNGGLYIEPESDVETEALSVLLHSVRYDRPPEVEDPRAKRTPDSACDDAELP